MLKLYNAIAVASVAVAVGVGAAAHAEQFVLDVPFADLMAAKGEILISDLRVGDIARIETRTLCADETGHTFIPGNTLTGAQVSDFSDVFEVKMLPGREIEVTVVVRNRNSRTTTPDAQSLILLTEAVTCDLHRLLKPATLTVDDFELLRVRTINGHSRLSDLFK